VKIPKLDFAKLGGIIPVVVQDAASGEVLMQAFLNQEAWDLTVREHLAHYYSRSRGRIWKKGERSGNIQHVEEIWIDCDDDSVLLKVRQEGDAACHTGYRSCYHRRVEGDEVTIVGKPLFDPRKVYGPGAESEEIEAKKGAPPIGAAPL